MSRHSQALDAALETKDTPIIITLLEELAARGALNAAIGEHLHGTPTELHRC